MPASMIRLAAVGALVALAGACAAAPTEPADDNSALAVAFEALAADANRDGDADRASGLSGGSIALRMGVRPSVIEVVVNGETVRHHALVAGVSREVGGQRRLVRTLFAWTGDQKPVTMLEVSLASNEAPFGGVLDDRATTARGTYLQLRDRQRWFANSGTAAIVLQGASDACGRPLSDNLAVDCTRARFNVQVSGAFHQHMPGTMGPIAETRITIATTASGINGVIVGPTT